MSNNAFYRGIIRSLLSEINEKLGDYEDRYDYPEWLYKLEGQRLLDIKDEIDAFDEANASGLFDDDAEGWEKVEKDESTETDEEEQAFVDEMEQSSGIMMSDLESETFL